MKFKEAYRWLESVLDEGGPGSGRYPAGSGKSNNAYRGKGLKSKIANSHMKALHTFGRVHRDDIHSISEHPDGSGYSYKVRGQKGSFEVPKSRL